MCEWPTERRRKGASEEVGYRDASLLFKAKTVAVRGNQKTWWLMLDVFPKPSSYHLPPPRSKMVAFSKLYYLVWRKIRRGWCNLCWWYRLFYWYTYCVRLTYLFYILSRLLKMKPRTVYMFNFLATQRCFLFCFSDYCYDRWNMYELFLLSKWCCISVYM